MRSVYSIYIYITSSIPPYRHSSTQICRYLCKKDELSRKCFLPKSKFVGIGLNWATHLTIPGNLSRLSLRSNLENKGLWKKQTWTKTSGLLFRITRFKVGVGSHFWKGKPTRTQYPWFSSMKWWVGWGIGRPHHGVITLSSRTNFHPQGTFENHSLLGPPSRVPSTIKVGTRWQPCWFTQKNMVFRHTVDGRNPKQPPGMYKTL